MDKTDRIRSELLMEVKNLMDAGELSLRPEENEEGDRRKRKRVNIGRKEGDGSQKAEKLTTRKRDRQNDEVINANLPDPDEEIDEFFESD